MQTVEYFIEALSSDLHTSPKKDVWITIAKELLDVSAFGNTANYAVALQALHLFTLNAEGTDLTAGKKTSDVIKKKEGEIEITYTSDSSATQQQQTNNELLRTAWGVQLNTLINDVVVFAIV